MMRYTNTPRGRLSHKLRDGAWKARKMGQWADPALTLQAAVHLLDQTECYYCGSRFLDSYEIDHKTPLQRGGDHTLSNICKACPKCNHEKGCHTEEEFVSGDV